jgi:thymidylate synthase (FAD)
MLPIEVNLIDYTGMNDPNEDAARDKLIYTKSTRLEQGKDTRKIIQEMSKDDKDAELKYMANTIPSSWEFANFTFEIKNVTRAFTHQLVRTRNASYAQQTMRMLNKKGFTYRVPPRLKDDESNREIYDDCMTRIEDAYDEMIENGVAVEDARGVLPTNIHTNIIMQINLRTFAEMARSRTGLRTQDEYREVMEQMISCTLDKLPWAKDFLCPELYKHISKIESHILEMKNSGNLSSEEFYDLNKSLDKIRKGES